MIRPLQVAKTSDSARKFQSQVFQNALVGQSLLPRLLGRIALDILVYKQQIHFNNAGGLMYWNTGQTAK
ncbi:MAG: hypothetical protein EZS28_031296 [Streblomastix strix]|uniref:Uncharacterized protein n=1 Tax=Streblomastix strix TaxID=222440 RepID=A0A5J4UR65_9EUKA|nr:MAG: hypothetical protein EZS28_031296 [Streblomastix strix]